MTGIYWAQEREFLQEKLDEGYSAADLAKHYGVSRSRLYQVMTKYGIHTGTIQRKNFLRDKPAKHYWLNRMLGAKGIGKAERMEILESIDIPDVCPILGIPLNYEGDRVGEQGWKRERDDSPSIDRIHSSKGYTRDNIQVISWRANRIKNDATPEELCLLAAYMKKVTAK